jgi:predicted ATP-grasp superfamily ATP-dependent carboligase
VGAVGAVMWDGELVCSVHMVADRIWPPHCGTFAYARTVPPDPELHHAAERLLTRLGWRGIFRFDWLEWRGHRYVIDLNPRIFTSLGLAIAAGANLPAVWVDLLLGRRPRVHGCHPGVRYRYEKDDVRAVLRGARAGGHGALRALAPRRATTHAVFSLWDPMPVMTTLSRARKVARR